MSLSAAAIRRMADMGLNAEQIAELCEVIEEGFAAPISTPSAAALRQRRYREKKAESATESVTRNVTRNVTNRTPEPTHSSEETLPPSPPKGGSSPTGAALAEPKPRRRSGSRFCPDDFEPSPERRAQAAARGLSPGDLERALSRFRNHEFPRPYTDWNRCFAKWIDREKPDARPASPPSPKLIAKRDNLERAFRAAERADQGMAAGRAG